MHKEAQRKLATAKMTLIIDHPFFGCLIMHMKPIETMIIDTMATDGKHLYYNPFFVMELSEDHLIGGLAHEGYHCAYRHHTRMGDRDPKRWNIATDYIINLDLTKCGFKLPDWVYLDKKWDGYSSEEVYNELVTIPPPPNGGYKPKHQQGKGNSQQQQNQGSGQGQQKPDKDGQQQGKGQGKGQGQQGQQSQGQGQGSGQGQPQNGKGQLDPSQAGNDPGGFGGVMAPVPQWDKAEMASEDARWEMITRQAVAVAKSQNAGVVPGFLQRLVGDLEKPRVEWEVHLRRFVDESISRDYTWMRPNRRFLHTGLTLPGLIPDKLQHIVSLMDTSGSITDKLIQKYAAEKRALMDEGFCDKLTIIYTDTVIQNVQTFERGDEIKLDPKGGGGTDFREAFKYVTKNCQDASVVLFFTDLIVNKFGDAQGLPVLWLVYGPHKAYLARTRNVPFGEHIHVAL